MQWLVEKLKYFKKILTEIKDKSQATPEGSLRAVEVKRNGKPYTQYYLCDGKKKNYLKKGNEKLLRSLAQKDYLKKVRKVLEKEIKVTERFLKDFDPDALKKVYENLPQGKKALVSPYQYPDREYAEKWQAKQYVGKGFNDDDPEIYTKRGERVRSKSEQLIADRLFYSGIPYRYEYPFELRNGKKMYIDFTILNVRTRTEYRLEHFGWMDDPGYRNNVFFKISDYANNGLLMGKNIVYTFEDSNNPLDSRYLDLLIRQFFL